MRILLTGRNGQIGWELERELPALGEVIATDRATLDLANNDSIRRAVREAAPDVIVNAGAYTAVDKAESEPELSMLVNGIAPGVLAEEAKRLGALLVHYSTDYVFDGDKRSPYIEDDAAKPLSHYGRTKLAGEEAAAAATSRHLILRTSWVYGSRAANFYQVILRKALAGEPMRMVDDQTSVPTTARFVAQHTIALIRKDHAGLLHLVPSGAATRYEFASEVVKTLGSRASVKRAPTSDFPTAARRPAYSVLDSGRAARAVQVAFPDWKKLLATHA